LSFINTHLPFVFSKHTCSRDSESDTCATDDERKWGGLGQFEYSRKGLPHCLLHFAELAMRGGHFAAFCTFLAEVSHKDNIKLAATLSRTEGSHNSSQQHMLDWYLLQQVYSAVIELGKSVADVGELSDNEEDSPVVADDEDPFIQDIRYELKYAHGWSTLLAAQVSWPWLSTFLSKQVRLTRSEFLRLLGFKLQMDPVIHSRDFYHKMLTSLTFRFGGVLQMKNSMCSRKYVGIDNSGRRDFVRLRGTNDHTCLSAQVHLSLKHTFAFYKHAFSFSKYRNYICHTHY